MKNILRGSKMVQAITILTVLKMFVNAQTTCNSGSGRVIYERLPDKQLQGFDDELIRESAPPFRVLEKCQEMCLKDRTGTNNLVRTCTSFDFIPGSRRASFGSIYEYEESTCYLTREQSLPDGTGNLIMVPNSVHFSEVCLTSTRIQEECPHRHYVFERHSRKKLKLPLTERKDISAHNRTECEDRCLNEFNFICRSATFDSSTRSCSLSRFTRRTHPELLDDDPNSEYLENTCLSAQHRCDGLFVFVREENKRLRGPFVADIYTNLTIDECQAVCLRAEKYFCRSIEFDEGSRQCFISEEDSVSQRDDMGISNGPGYHFYDLICLDNPRGSEYPDNISIHRNKNVHQPDTAFQRFRNSRLSGEFHSEITGRSLSECLEECLRQTSFQCKSAVYSGHYHTCRMSSFNQKDGHRIIFDADYDHYENLMHEEHNRLGLKKDPVGQDTKYGRPFLGRPGENVFPNQMSKHTNGNRNYATIPHNFGKLYRSNTNLHQHSSGDRHMDEQYAFDGISFHEYIPYSNNHVLNRFAFSNQYPLVERNAVNKIQFDKFYAPNDRYNDIPRNEHYSIDRNNRVALRENTVISEGNRYAPQNRYPNGFEHWTREGAHNYLLGDRNLNDKFSGSTLHRHHYAPGRITSNRNSNTEKYNQEIESENDKRKPGERIPLAHHSSYMYTSIKPYLYGSSYDDGKPIGGGYIGEGGVYNTKPFSGNGNALVNNNGHINGIRPPLLSRCDEHDNFRLIGQGNRVRKPFIRKYVSANSIVQCERECSESRDFFCRSFNFKPVAILYGSKQDNCELSDRDSRDMDVGNPVYYDTLSDYDFFERTFGKQGTTIECLDVMQVCNEDGMEFTLRTPEGFVGRIYTYGYYDRCFFRGNGGTVNILRISGAQGYPECGTQRYGDTLTNIVIVQFSDYVQTGRDKRFNLTCIFKGSDEAVVTSGYIGAGKSGSPIPVEYLPAENTLSTRVRLIILYQGRPTTTIAVGDPLTFRLEAQDGYNNPTDIFATNVVARDPYSGRSVELIDRYGCPVDNYVFPGLDRLREGESLEARFNAFKIPESNFLVFEANVKTCRDGCQPAFCSSGTGRSEPSFGRRKRYTHENLDNYRIQYRQKIKETPTQNITESENETNIQTETAEEFVREMIEVFESRYDIEGAINIHNTEAYQQSQNQNVCVTQKIYYGFIVTCIILIVLTTSAFIAANIVYRRYIIPLKNVEIQHPNSSKVRRILEENCSSENNNTNSMSFLRSQRSNTPYSTSVARSINHAAFQFTRPSIRFGGGAEFSLKKPLNFDLCEPIYTDPSLFQM